MPVLYKSDGTVEFATVAKATDEDAGELTCVVYPVERADADNHLASAEVIKQMAHDFQREGGQIDVRHNGKAVSKDQAYVAENFIVQKGDPRFEGFQDYDGNAVDTDGAWATVIKIDDPELRRLYREGEWNGVSMFGTGLLEVSKADEDAPGWFRKFLSTVGLGAALNNPSPQEIEMNKQELEEVFEKQFSKLTDTIAKALTKEDAPAPEPKADVKKEDTVDLTDADAVRAHLASLEKEDLDLTDADAVREHLAKLEKAEAEADDGDDSDEVKELKAKLRKAESASKQGTGADITEVVEGFSKEGTEALAIGRRMAEFNNNIRG